MRQITEIIVHSTATPKGMNATAKDIDKWHRLRGYNCIGYHFVILRDGTIERGRAVEMAGAHCKGNNADTIGVAYVGGLNENKQSADTRTGAQKIALNVLLADLLKQYPTIRKISGHRDYCNTACPSFDASAEYQHLIK
jgi:N-acetylmuramoyl-L-alanine amidase